MTTSILCFGDSNTHGYNPKTTKRFPLDVRWPSVLQNELGKSAHIIEEGLNGRTTIYNEDSREGRNGANYLPVILESHAPFDILILMLGTNDVLKNKDITAQDAANGVSELVYLTRNTFKRLEYPLPKIVIVSPVITLTPHKIIDAESVGNPIHTHHFSEYYFKLAKKENCLFIDAAKIVTTSPIDGAHFDESNHLKLGLAIADFLRDVI